MLNGQYTSIRDHVLNGPGRDRFMSKARKAANPINPEWQQQLKREQSEYMLPDCPRYEATMLTPIGAIPDDCASRFIRPAGFEDRERWPSLSPGSFLRSNS
jgi:hypothetical protein